MYRRELLILAAFSCALFLSVTGGVSLAVRSFQIDAKRIAEDNLPGLVYAGEAIQKINRQWFHTYRLLTIDDLATREQLIRDIEADSTTALWDSYQRAIYNPKDAELYREVIRTRSEFLSLRDDFFSTISSGNITESTSFHHDKLTPAFERYVRAASEIFHYNAENGTRLGTRVLRNVVWSPFLLACVSVGILLIGVVIGFKMSLGAFSPNIVDKEFDLTSST